MTSTDPATAGTQDATAPRWWASWYFTGPFTYDGPWWISGYGHGTSIICAAVIAPTADDARALIMSAHDDPQSAPQDADWRFIDSRAADFSPFGSRFPRADWMRWPAAQDQ